MPIVNLTSGVIPSPGWPELGRFPLGDPKRKTKNRSGKEIEVMGRNRSDFRLEWTSPLVEDDPERLAAWNKVMLDLFGENPQVLRGIQFMSSDPGPGVRHLVRAVRGQEHLPPLRRPVSNQALGDHGRQRGLQFRPHPLHQGCQAALRLCEARPACASGFPRSPPSPRSWARS